MRRSAFVFVLAAAILATACSTDESNPSPTEPSAEPSPTLEPALALRCRQNGLIVVQLARILPPGAPLRLLAKGVAKWVLVEVALVTRKPALAKARALDLIDFITKNRNNLINANSPLTLTRLVNVTDAILCEVGLPLTGVTDPLHTGIGVVPGNNPTPVIITTPQGDAGLRVPIGGAPTTVVVTVTGGLTTPLNTPLDQYGQTIDLTASQDVLWQNGGVTVALCVAADDAIFDRLRVGHEGGEPQNKFGAIEILPVAEETAANVAEILGTSCSTSSGGRAGFERLKEFAQRVLLPDPLYALAAAATVGGKGGQASKFSKFRAVDPQLDVLANPALPASTEGAAGAPVAQPPSVLVRTKSALQTPIPGILIKFKVTAGTGSIDPADPASVTTGSNGVATADSWTLSLGPNTATATAVSPVPAAVNEITFTPPGSVTFTATGTNPVQLTVVSGDAQTGFTNQILTAPIVVQVTQDGEAVEGAPVTFQASPGSGSFSPTPVPTNSDGFAESNWTLGAATGPQSASASTPGASPVPLSATATPAPPARVVLQWGASPADLDAHLTGPLPPESRFHVFYAVPGNLTASPFAALDRDDQDSFGPETITIANQLAGTYRFSVHDFSNRLANSDAPSSALAGSVATVTLYLASGVTQVFPVPNQAGTLWTVFELSNGTITPVNSMGYTSDPFSVNSFSVVRRAIDAIQTDASAIRDAVNAHRK